MLDRGAIVRFACMKCRNIFDVDLWAVARVRGRGFSLLGHTAKCKASSCRGNGHFIFAAAPEESFLLLIDHPEINTPKWLRGLRPRDIDSEDDPPPKSPAVTQEAPRLAG